MAELQQTLERLRGNIGEGDPFWRLAEMQVRNCVLDAIQKEAEGPSERDTGTIVAPLGVNPDAPEGWSLSRKRHPLENGKKSKGKGRGKGKESMAAQSPEQPAADKANKAIPFPAAQKSKQLPVLLNAIENQTAGQRRSAVAAEHQAKKKAAATYAQLATHAAVPVQQLRATQLSEAAAKPVQALAKASTRGTMASHVLTARNLGPPPTGATPLVQPLLPAAPLLAAAVFR